VALRKAASSVDNKDAWIGMSATGRQAASGRNPPVK
jgi:hypothetical protein